MVRSVPVVRAHLVHHVGDRGAASRVHHRNRAAPSAPETNLPVGNRGNAFRTRQSEADAVSQGIVSTTSIALDCSSKIRSMVSGLSNCTPFALPPNEIGDNARASARALPVGSTD